MEQDFGAYDYLVQVTVLNLYTKSKEQKEIRLKGLDLRNKSHLFFLHCALLTRNVSTYPIVIEGNWFKRLRVNMLIGNKVEGVQSKKLLDEGAIDVQELADFEQVICDEKHVTYAEVYKAYYERNFKLWKKKTM